MGTNETSNPVIGILLACVAASVILAAVGFALRRRGTIASRRAALVWALLTIAPLFGAGLAMMIDHQAELATGEKVPGRNVAPLH